MIGGSKYEVLERHEIDGRLVLRVRWKPGGERWCCTCAEYLAIKPLSMKAWCKHCEWAVMGKAGATGFGLSRFKRSRQPQRSMTRVRLERKRFS